MRSSFIGSLVGELRFNLARKGRTACAFSRCSLLLRVSGKRILAIRRERFPATNQPPFRIGGLATARLLPSNGAFRAPVDFYDVKGRWWKHSSLRAKRVSAPLAHPGLHPGRARASSWVAAAIGWLGELHPRWLRKYDLPRAAVLFELDVTGWRGGRARYRGISEISPRDSAIVFPWSSTRPIPVSGILDELREIGPPWSRIFRL